MILCYSHSYKPPSSCCLSSFFFDSFLLFLLPVLLACRRRDLVILLHVYKCSQTASFYSLEITRAAGGAALGESDAYHPPRCGAFSWIILIFLLEKGGLYALYELFTL